MAQLMDLNDRSAFKRLDERDMLAEIDGLPDQLDAAWRLRLSLETPHFGDIQSIVLAGMGGSAIGADLVAALVRDTCKIPLFVQREYDLPAWVKGKDSLVVVSSHSGNTEESLEVFQAALQRGCSVLAICTGGRLGQLAMQAGVPTWKFVHEGQPRAAVGFSFGLQLALLHGLALIPDPTHDLTAAIIAMEDQQRVLMADIPVQQNPAKRLAGQMMGRLVTIVGADVLAPVARRWSTQVNELAKNWSQFESIPELNHNSIAGAQFPEELALKRLVVFLRGDCQLARNKQRIDWTMQRYLEDGLAVDSFMAKGSTALEQLWTALHFGDYTAYYLAMLSGMDPTPIEPISWLKKRMENGKSV
jgi:glucose/mannose-6-phosphate isomerase